MNSSLCDVATCALFPFLDLQDKQLSEVKRIFDDLFNPLTSSGRLRHHRFRSVRLSIEEALYETFSPLARREAEKEAERQDWINRCLEQVSGAGTLSLTLCLSVNQEQGTLYKGVLPALRSIDKHISSKVGNVEVRLCCDESASVSQAMDRRTFSSTLGIFEADLVTALHFDSVRFSQDPQSIEAVEAPFLRQLTVSECFGNLAGWNPRNLRKLDMTFGDSADLASCTGLPAALQLIRSSAETLQDISLKYKGMTNEAWDLETAPIHLPSLTQLHILDGAMKEESLLEDVITSMNMPELQTLTLETAYTHLADVSHLLDKLPSLRKLNVLESRLLPLNMCDDDYSYPAIAEACEAAGIELRNEYAVLSIADEQQLEDDLERVQLLASTLRALSLGLSFSALDHIRAGIIIDLPNLESISVRMADVSGMPGDSKLPSPGPSIFGLLLSMLDASAATKLQLNIFLGKNDHLVSDLIDFLVTGQLPSLREVGGSIALAAIGASGRSCRDQEEELRHACQLLGIDATALVFLGNTVPDDDEDEEIDSEGYASNEEAGSEWYDEDDDQEDCFDDSQKDEHGHAEECLASAEEYAQDVILGEVMDIDQLFQSGTSIIFAEHEAIFHELEAMEMMASRSDREEAMFSEISEDLEEDDGMPEVRNSAGDDRDAGPGASKNQAKDIVAQMNWLGDDDDMGVAGSWSRTMEFDEEVELDARGSVSQQYHCPGCRCSS